MPEKSIQEKIIKVSKELFAEQGFKKTGIRQIVEATNISIGTFYNYFDSKEELFLEIYLEENKKAHDEIREDLAKLVEQDEDPIKILKMLLHTFFNNAKNNPILKEFFNREQFDKIMEKLTPEDDKEYTDYVLEPLIPYFNQWQEENKLIDIQPRLLMGLINSIAYVYSHKEHIGEKLFPELLDYLIEAVVERLRPN